MVTESIEAITNERDYVMNIPDGIYTIMGPGGQITNPDPDQGVFLLPPQGDPTQQWAVTSNSDTCTLRNVATGTFLGNDGDPTEPAMMVKGTRRPFTWQLSLGPDGNPFTFVLTSAASDGGLILTMSMIRIYPPQLAILDSNDYSTFEWQFRPV